MRFDEATLFAFLLVFVRSSAMFLSSPIFGSNLIPLQVRIFSGLSLSAAITAVVRPKLGPMPPDLIGLFLAVGGEAVAGLLIGSLMNLVMQAVQMAGGILDFQVGLGMSQVLNPVAGVPVTILSQLKVMLASVVFLTADCHHTLIQSLVQSYQAAPNLSAASLPALQSNILSLLGEMSLLAIQIAAPVMAVSMVVDAALGLISKAVPQMQAIQVGGPAKIGFGLIAVSVCLPPLVSGVTAGTKHVADMLQVIFHG